MLVVESSSQPRADWHICTPNHTSAFLSCRLRHRANKPSQNLATVFSHLPSQSPAIPLNAHLWLWPPHVSHHPSFATLGHTSSVRRHCTNH